MSSVPPSMGMSARDNYTTTTPGLHRHPHTTLSPRYSDTHRYHSQPETPRSLLPPAMPPTNYATAYQSAYTPHSGANESPPFNAQETYHTIMCEGVSIVPTIEAKIEKGFFLSGDDVWTCYRRNYFAVNVSYTLNPWTNANNSRLYLDQGNGKPQEPIQSMAVSLAAAVDGSAGKTIELIQHTPKRDKGPQLEMKKELLAPTPPGKNHDHSTYGYHQSSSASGPLLPLQSIEGDSSQSYSPTSHTNNNHQHPFERIQFKSATANNGKRRAQQQYYHLIVELWANIQNTRDHEPRWVKVAAKLSHPVVVRGRSPSHYQNEGPHNATARGPGNSGFGGSGQNGLSSHGRTSYSAFGNGLSGGGATGMGGGMYRGGTTYSLDPSPVGSHSVSSASSMSGGPSEGLVGDQHMVDEDDPKILGGQHPYQYFPSALYEDLPPKVDGVLPPLERRVVKEEYQRPSALATGWQVGGCGRYTGMESSHGYYPEVHASSGY
jgi:meiosis-specific transcription factor NDT80